MVSFRRTLDSGGRRGGNTESDQELPSKQNFGGANGGEYRMSFPGYAPGFVQVIESPH